MEIKKIIITSDLLRPVWINGKAKNKETVRINKYYDFLYWQLSQAVNVPVKKISENNSQFSFFNFYKCCGISFKSIDSWLEIYNLKDIPQEAINYFGKYFDNSFIICHEMPPVFKNICTKLGIKYIDIRVHPVRFLDDHLWGMSTNDSYLFDELKKYQVDENYFYFSAQMYKATADFYDLNIDDSSALIAGQTNIDAALYEKGTVHSIFEYEDEIKALGKEYNTVYYKPHPFNSDLEKTLNFLKKYDFIKFTNDNIYSLLSNDKINIVCAISSSVLTEAKYFGKETKAFFRPFNKYVYGDYIRFSPEVFVSIMDDYYNPVFWRDILQHLKITKISCPNFAPPFRPNRMRAALNDYWGNTKFDPDVITVTKEKESIVGRVTNSDNDFQIKALKSRVDHMNGLYYKIVNDPAFEKNAVKRTLKRHIFKKGEKNVNTNAKIVYKKFETMGTNYHDSFEKVEKIKCLTYRPSAPRGGRGGAGAVLSAMKKIIGDKIDNIPVEYVFSQKDGVWHNLNNKFFNEWTYPNYINKDSNLIMLWAAVAFVFDKTANDDNTLYVCHEYSTAFGLALMKKKYLLVIHTQGTRVEEKTNLGEYATDYEKKIISKCESVALQNAVKVCFPSIGGKEFFFRSKYCNVERNSVSIGDTLYNTIYADVTEKKVEGINEDSKIITFLSVGTVTVAKGQDRVADFFENLLSNNNDIRFRWICVGRGPYADIVTEKASLLSNSCSNFEFIYIPKCTFNEVKYLQMISDYYIMLHRISIFDLATLEAMKNGCTPVLSRLGGNLEYNIDDNVIYFDDNYQSLADKIITTDKEEMKEKNRRCYNNYFSEEQFKERYINQIKRVIEEINP